MSPNRICSLFVVLLFVSCFIPGFAQQWSEKSNGLATMSNVAIDTVPVSGYALSVNGKILVEEVLVESSDNWPDFVFAKAYELKELSVLRAYIEKHRHLPGMPPGSEITDIKLGANTASLLRKIEELYLYLIAMDKENKSMEAENQQMATDIDRILSSNH